MAATFMDDMTGLFKSQALGEAAARLGEPESSVLSGFRAAAAAIVGGLASHAGETGFMRQVYDLISSQGDGSGILGSLRGFFSGSSATAGTASTAGTESLRPGGKMLSMLFGNNQETVSEGISRASGLRPSSASTLMSFAAPMVLGLLGKKVSQEHLDVSSFSNLVQTEGAGVRSMIPAGLSGIKDTAYAARSEASQVVSSASSNRWLWPLIGLLALVGLIWYLATRNRVDVNRATSAVTDTARSATDAVRTSVANLGSFAKTTLVNGVELNIPSNGMEMKLLNFIKDPSIALNTTSWFNFDRINFDTSSASLLPDSQEQLGNLAAMLKAYPTVHLKIGGYTDNTGDAAANMQLSQQRADTVRQSLISMGIAADRLEAQGYGSQYPVADNSTEEGRAQNRRIAVLVTQR